MKREATNIIRMILEDCIPPILRDSRAFAWLARAAFGRQFDLLAEVRHKAALWNDKEMKQFYASMKQAQKKRGTDNSKEGIAQITKDIVGSSIIDVGCGHGVLLAEIKGARHDITDMTGVDYVIPEEVLKDKSIHWKEASITRLPFQDRTFDTVICTHTLEHVVDIGRAISQLRRIARKRVIIVVPRERPYKYTFNSHLHYFPYLHILLTVLRPTNIYTCRTIGRDLYYVEEIPKEPVPTSGPLTS